MWDFKRSPSHDWHLARVHLSGILAARAEDYNFRSTLLLQVFQRQWKKPVTQMAGISLVTCMEASKNAWGKRHTHTSVVWPHFWYLSTLQLHFKKLPRNPKGHCPELGSSHSVIQALPTDFTTWVYSRFLILIPTFEKWQLASPDSQALSFLI